MRTKIRYSHRQSIRTELPFTMIDEAQLNTWLARIKLPERDLRELSFCASNKPAKVHAWVQELPMTRISYVCSLLYQALPEVARLNIAPEQRLEMLESLR